MDKQAFYSRSDRITNYLDIGFVFDSLITYLRLLPTRWVPPRFRLRERYPPSQPVRYRRAAVTTPDFRPIAVQISPGFVAVPSRSARSRSAKTLHTVEVSRQLWVDGMSATPQQRTARRIRPAGSVHGFHRPLSRGSSPPRPLPRESIATVLRLLWRDPGADVRPRFDHIRPPTRVRRRPCRP